MATTNTAVVLRETAMTTPETMGAAIDPFATLINKKILLPSQKTNYIAAETHFLVMALRGQVEQIFVDEDWYLLQHPDVQIAMKDGLVNGARDHYAHHGFYEHRLPYAIKVDEEWYLSQYTDINKAVQDGAFATGQAHFDKLGYREGRLPYAGFQLKTRNSTI